MRRGGMDFAPRGRRGKRYCSTRLKTLQDDPKKTLAASAGVSTALGPMRHARVCCFKTDLEANNRKPYSAPVCIFQENVSLITTLERIPARRILPERPELKLPPNTPTVNGLSGAL